MTELAYLADMPSAYVTEFRARIMALPPGGVVLDRTYFYPTGGGQPSDRGTLGIVGGAAAEVVEVSKSGGSVVHRLRGPSGFLAHLARDQEVDGRIDWPRRHQHMRLHTAQHLLSAHVFLATGLRTRRANLGGLRATLDLEGPLPDDALPRLVDEVRRSIESPRTVRIRHLPRSEWDANPVGERSGLVPLPPQVDPVRVIEIEGTDICPCGGTHVRSTGEIGLLRFDPLGARTRLAFTLAEPDPPTPSG